MPVGTDEAALAAIHSPVIGSLCNGTSKGSHYGITVLHHPTHTSAGSHRQHALHEAGTGHQFSDPAHLRWQEDSMSSEGEQDAPIQFS